MEKDEAEVLEEGLQCIIASKKLVETSRGPMWLQAPTLDDKIVSRHIYKTKYNSLINAGVVSADQMLQEYIEQGIWEEAKEKNLQVLPDMIKEVQGRIERERNRVKLKKLGRWLNELLRQHTLLMNERNTRLANSAEFLAHETASLYLIWAGLVNITGERPYLTFKELEESRDIEWINELMQVYYENAQDLDEKVIRAIARSTSWRIRWNTFSKDCETLFGRTAQHLNNDQFMLVYWSQVYDSVYESLDRPPEEVVKDDEALDQWLLKRHEERTREIGQKYFSRSTSTKGNSKIENAPEVYRTVDGYFDNQGVWQLYTNDERRQQIEKIRNLNSPTSRRLKQLEEDKLRQTPGVFVQEGDLRKRREHREAMGGNVTIKGRNVR